MPHCLLDQHPRLLNSGLKTWGDLLHGLDHDCSVDRRAVTVVRFDGVEEPSFRSPEVTARPLAPLRRIEVETIDRARLLRGTLGTAGQSLPSLAAAASRAGMAFRRRDLAGGHAQLTAMVAAIRTLTLLTVASATASGVELDVLPCGGVTAGDVMGAVGVVLDMLVQEQAVRDWVALADVLEFDLVPALLEWGVIFDTLQDRAAA
jgi:hypothetical protein